MSEFSEQVTDFVGRLSYKDWRFEIYSLGDHHCGLFIGPPGRSVPNSYQERDWLQKFYAPVSLRADMGVRDWVRAVHVAILALEDHEVFEWFKLDGRAAIDPHKVGWADYEVRKSALQRIEG